MIRKFRAVPAIAVAVLITIFAGASAAHAQDVPSTAPAQQPSTTQQPEPTQTPQAQPPEQQPSGQEASEEETAGARKKKVKDYRNWTFNAGGGVSLLGGTTQTYVRGGGGLATAGVARNSSKYLGLRLDFQYANLPLKNQALELAQAPKATTQAYTVTLDPIINIPVSHDWGGYIVLGATYIHRSGKLDSSTARVGESCDGFFTWWGTCYAGSLPINGKFLDSSLNQYGYNFGGGITRKIRPNIDLYAEFRFIHASKSGVTTDIRPITIGLRW